VHWSVAPVPYRPGAQSEHVAEPAAAHVPGLHGVQVIAFDDADVPAGQLAQILESVHKFDVAPGKAYFPRGQEIVLVQLLDVSPVVEPYVPAGQRVQVADPAVE
jgi:hypothetical protein